ncbi:MAG TPA: hypothetical protein VFA46_23360 [Actinomycetes bacterium]|nr:hypothetical protein [Actinomycetes bacterium]
MLVYLLNAVLFVLVGLQLHLIHSGVGGHSAAVLLGQAALDRRPSQRLRRVGARERLVVGWSGMCGAGAAGGARGAGVDA